MQKTARGEDRLNRIERQVQEIAREVSKISNFIANNPGRRLPASRISAEADIAQTLGTAQWENVNPWALQTAIELGSALASDIAPLRTYSATIEALKSSEDGCTAEEVSQKTGRSRNTESGYMNRLFNVGILDKFKSGRKTKYMLKDKAMWDALSQTG
jgi:hypothetical protein